MAEIYNGFRVWVGRRETQGQYAAQGVHTSVKDFAEEWKKKLESGSNKIINTNRHSGRGAKKRAEEELHERIDKVVREGGVPCE
jgi:hypothetical protein